jgi:hypothetical protein
MKGVLLASLFFILTTAAGNSESNNFITIAPDIDQQSAVSR